MFYKWALLFLLFSKRNTSASLETQSNVNRTIADRLKETVRVLCWIATFPDNHMTKAIHVKRTWGQHCTILLFMSSEKDDRLPTVKLNVTEGRNQLWHKTHEAFRYVYAHYYNLADWFMKADDDTYIIVENLRFMLSKYDTSHPLYFGLRFYDHFNKIPQWDYMEGGHGYILSREAMRRLGDRGLASPHVCVNATEDVGNDGEDQIMGRCLLKLGVVSMDSRDRYQHDRFRSEIKTGADEIDDFYADPLINVFYYKRKDEGFNCCSDFAISLHHIASAQQYRFHYLITHLKPYGIGYKHALSDMYEPKSAYLIPES